jgi:class 3 adenylate cyclase/tetratricopeptide (TPR) repeat protein
MSIARFVPESVRRRLAIDPSPLTAPTGEAYDAAVLLADIKGFTRLSERLAEEGVRGAERLTACLNRYFGELLQIIRSRDGEVVKFAGDALLAEWSAGEGGLAEATERAASASLAIQALLHDFEVDAGVRLSMRISLGAGRLNGLHVGGVLGRWEYFVTGDPMKQLGAAQAAAEAGEVVCSRAAWELLSGTSEGETLAGGLVRLVRCPEPKSTQQDAAPFDPADQELLRSFLPGFVTARVGAGQQDWLGELRPVSTLFVHLPDLADSTSDDLGPAQEAVALLQRAIYRFEGAINKISVDDKGVAVVAAMGLPPLAHEDDPDRAVKAAVLAQDQLRAAGFRASFGISTGTAYCGAVGDDARAEYTVIGDSVNMAARLMQRADGEILVEGRTFARARDTATFESLPPVMLKGKGAPVPVYRPTGQFIARAPSLGLLVGRSQERGLVTESLRRLVEDSAGGQILLEGEAGIGKSRLVSELLTWAVAVDVQPFVGGGDPVERSLPYHAWKQIVSAVLGLAGGENDEEARARVMEALPEADRPLAPLLSPVLPFDFEDNDLTAEMGGVVRSDNTDACLLRLLGAQAKKAPLLLVLEDAHWMDSRSWALLERVAHEVEPALTVLSTRPVRPPVPEAWPRLTAMPGTQRCTLQPLAHAATLELVCGVLGIPSLPQSVADLFRARGEGNPYFCQELAAALRERGTILVIAGVCVVPGGPQSLADLELPDTVQGLVNSRVDRLPPLQQLVLKVASVMGRTFPLRGLQALYPVDADRAGVDDALLELCERGLLVPHVDGSPGVQYAFRHAIAREAVYSLMLFSQRRDLHRATAEWLESEETTPAALLAHHWAKAEVWDRAAPALAAAGLEAVRESSNIEAVQFLERALELDREHNLGHTAVVRGGWHARIQDAWFAAGRLDEARDAALSALRLLGQPAPGSVAGWAAAFFGSAAVRVLQSFLLPLFAVKSPDKREAAREAAHLYLRLLEIFFYQNDPNRGLVAGFRSINLAERVDPGREFARGFSMMAAVMDAFMLPSVGDRWGVRAMVAAEATGDRATLAYTLSRVGVRAITATDWATADRHLQRGLELSTELGERRLWEENASLLGKAAQFRGRFAEAETRWREVTTAAVERDAQQIIAWGQLSVAWNLVWLGRASEALDFMAPELARSEGSDIDHDVLWASGIHAFASLEAGDHAAAKASATEALSKMSTAQPYPYFMMPAVAATAIVALRLVELASPEDRPARLKAAAKAVKNLAFIGRFFPFARPMGGLLKAELLRLRGRGGRAVTGWRKVLASGNTLGTPLEVALAHRSLAAHGPKDQRASHLRAAIEGLGAIGAGWMMDGNEPD